MTVRNCTPLDDLQAILDNITTPATIYLAEGVYKQKLIVRRDDVKIIGASRETTKITFDDFARKPHPDGREYNTFRTFTLCVTGERVSLENLCVENSNAHPEKVGQCVALSVNSKSFKAKNVKLVSTQDTLFTAPFPDDLVVRYSGLTDDPTYYDGFIARDQLYIEGQSVHLFEDCEISGTVDFIFGGAEGWFKNCRIVSLKDERNCGYVAAPSHSLKQETGYVFVGCRFINGGATPSTVYLARPWRDFGKCEFLDCEVEDHVSPELFDKWNDTYRDRTARFSYANLKFGFTPSPVRWCSEICAERRAFLLKREKELFGK